VTVVKEMNVVGLKQQFF